MNETQRIAHLLRRFGLGASQAEMKRYSALGLHKTIDALLQYDPKKAPEVSPFEFVFVNNQNMVDFNPARLSAWWGLQFVLTDQPLQERLALFWHDHFAVSASKVENSLMMLKYLNLLREGGIGNFRQLIGDLTADPAMLRWLDGETSVKGRPNENFAREVMELFTLGVGNYTERDVAELARAFTGWGLRVAFRYGTPAANRAQLVESMESGRPFVAAAYSPDFHDDGPKTVLGKTARFDTDSALDHLVSRPRTAQYLATKLWEYFAYPNPEPRVVERVAKSFVDGKYEMKAVLLTIATTPEFWSEKCVRKQVKCPIDFVVPPLRQLGFAELALKQRPTNAGPSKPIEGPLLSLAGAVESMTRRMGLRLLFPPDVAGWNWGDGWISPAMMMERLKYADVLMANRQGSAVEIVRNNLSSPTPADSGQLAAAFAGLFDVPLTLTDMQVLTSAIDAAGGVEGAFRPNVFPNLARRLTKLVFAMPSYQLC
ncbi:MAG: DUF1800 domain-containing protein [Armatimonadetes bacterium]|nr:MAG: DUF1800 domain-containing protein [Armatimonadota bacterium]